MIRLVRGVALTALLLSLPMSASALGISIAGYNSTSGSQTLAPGDTITVDLVVENNGGLDINGLGLAVTGYDDDRNGIADSGLVYSTGQVTPGLFNTLRSPGTPNQAFGGISNIRSPGGPVEQWLFDAFDPQELRLSIYDGADLASSDGTGGDDIGVGGGYVGDGDIHFQITFAATSSASAGDSFLTLQFGTNAEYGAVAIGPGGETIDGFRNASLALTIIPEPGTALLMGLGLVGLAANRRR